MGPIGFVVEFSHNNDLMVMVMELYSITIIVMVMELYSLKNTKLESLYHVRAVFPSKYFLRKVCYIG